MDANQAEASLIRIQLKNSKIADEPHVARLETSLLAFLIGQQTTRCGTKLYCADEALWRVPRQIQGEILVEIGHVGHPALARQPQPFAIAVDPRVVGPAMNVKLRDRNYFMSDTALLVVPVVGFIRAPTDFSAAELERLRQR